MLKTIQIVVMLQFPARSVFHWLNHFRDGFVGIFFALYNTHVFSFVSWVDDWNQHV